jgi:hypothetical protein
LRKFAFLWQKGSAAGAIAGDSVFLVFLVFMVDDVFTLPSNHTFGKTGNVRDGKDGKGGRK